MLTLASTHGERTNTGRACIWGKAKGTCWHAPLNQLAWLAPRMFFGIGGKQGLLFWLKIAQRTHPSQQTPWALRNHTHLPMVHLPVQRVVLSWGGAKGGAKVGAKLQRGGANGAVPRGGAKIFC